jgi:hypothetical protein
MMAEHRTTFTAHEWLAVRVLVGQLLKAPKEDQELLRGGLRGIGFYISDYTRAENRFVVSDLDRILDSGDVRIRG